jgi:uncharacterized protein (TIGR02466 family)
MIIDNFIDEHECDEILTYIRGLDMHQQDDTVPVNAKSSFDGVTDIVKDVSKHTAVDDFYDRTTFALNEYANVIGQPELKLSNSWSHIQYEGSYVVDHTHPNSKVSGVLYLNTSKDSNNLIFKNPNPYSKIDAPVKGTDFNFTINEIPVGNGRLVMFPSWLEHGSNYNINKTQGRTMISFNSLVK